MNYKMIPLRMSVLLILQFLGATGGEENDCSTETKMSSQFEDIKTGAKELGKLFSENESVDWGKIGTGFIGYLQIGMESFQAIPVVGPSVYGMAKMFLPAQATDELKCMAQEFKKINAKLDKIEKSIENLSKDFKAMFQKLMLHCSAERLRQDYNEIGEHKRVVVDSLKMYFDDTAVTKATLLHAKCSLHNPFLMGLRAIEVLVTDKGRIGTEFLKGIIDASGNSSSAYFSVVKVIVKLVNELVDLDKICDAILHPNSNNDVLKRVLQLTNSTAQNIFEALVGGEYYRQTNVFNDLVAKNFAPAFMYDEPLRVNYLSVSTYRKSDGGDGKYAYNTGEYDDRRLPTTEPMNNPQLVYAKRLIAYLENQLNLIGWVTVAYMGDVRDGNGNIIPTLASFWPYINALSACCLSRKQIQVTHGGYKFSLNFHIATNVTDAMRFLEPLFKKRKEKLASMMRSLPSQSG